ncbi:MAG: hypothetical protein ACK4N5_01350 [Myxococcales bacterium]
MRATYPAAVLAACAALTGCTSVTLRTTARIDRQALADETMLAEQQKTLEYEQVRQYPTHGTAVACFLTVVFYGGACWAYLAMPYDSHEAQAKSDAKQEIRSRYGERAAQDAFLRVERIGW